MNGYFRNILPFLLFDDQYLGIESPFINIEEILPAQSEASNESIKFSIYPKLLLDFNCTVDKLKYRKFNGRRLTGDLKVKDSRIFAQNIEFEAMGGKLKFTGLVNASGENIIVSNSSHWENLAC